MKKRIDIDFGQPGAIRAKAEKEPGPGSWHTAHVAGVPYPITFRVGQAEGRLVVSGLAIGLDGPVDVQARGLRDIPIGALLEQIGRHRGIQAAFAFTATPVSRPPRRGRRPSLDRAFFEEVAKVYHEVLGHTPRTRSPIPALKRRLHVSDATARRYIERLNDHGLLDQEDPR